jgi:homoserine kinase
MSHKVTGRSSWNAVRVPATSANMGSGFDTLAIAFSLFAWFWFRRSETDKLDTVTGVDAEFVTLDPANHLFFTSMDSCCAELGVRREGVELMSRAEAPLRCGLGSSAAVRVAAIYAAATLAGIRLTRDEVFAVAAKQEGHPDNVAAAVYGGMTVATSQDHNARAIRLPLPPILPLGFQLIIPSYRKQSTEQIRRVLPTCVPWNDAIANIQSTGMLISGFVAGDVEAIAIGCRDRLHQMYRAPLLPGVADVLAMKVRPGMIGATISGAGPAMLLMHLPNVHHSCEEALRVFRLKDPKARLLPVQLSSEGYQSYEGYSYAPYCSLGNRPPGEAAC